MTMLTLVTWLAIAAVGGFAAILGSLMTLGTLLLWLVPGARVQLPDATSPLWQSRLKLLGVSVALTIGGLALLRMIAPPQP
jgi:hypothetical protein